MKLPASAVPVFTTLLRPRVLLPTALLAAFCLTARADYLDNVEVHTSARDVVIRIHFNTSFQYLRHVPEKQGDVVQIFLRQQSGEVPPPVAEETRSVKATDLSPKVTVIYPLQTGAPTKRLLVKFGHIVQFRVRQGIDPHSVEIVLPSMIIAKPRKPPTPSRYAIYLDSFASVEQATVAALPSELARYDAFVSKSEIAGVALYDRNIGYFDSAEAAEVMRERLLRKFPDARVVDAAAATVVAKAALQSQPTQQAPVATTPAVPPAKSAALPQPPPAPFSAPAPVAPGPAEPTAAVTKQPPLAAADVERQARELMATARSAFEQSQFDEAINTLNQLLILPPNSRSQQAQEMVGLARERSGQIGKAKAEYELYLKLYPESEGAQRVKERLAALEKRQPGTPITARTVVEPAEARAPVKTVFGSFAQYYYDGSTKSETAFNTPTTVDQATLTSRDLSAIVTSADLNARYRSDTSDVRLVFRDTDTHSLLDRNPSRNRLDAAYVDYRGVGLQNPMSLRLGRQIGTSGGILGSFDGAIAGYKVARNWRINAQAGQPVDYGLDSRRYFYGMSLDAENIFDSWSGNMYGIRQRVDGIADREALGGEIRYFRNGNSLYSMVDYDTLFKTVNIATVQASVQTKGQTMFTLLADQRKAPPLSTTNAVFGQPVTSIKQLLATNTPDQLRERALAITSDVRQYLASVTTPVSASWQLGADYRLTNVGPLPAYNDIPATAGTGNISGYTLQAIGSNLYSSRDTSVLSATLLKSPQFRGEYVSYSNLTGLGARWTIEPSVRWYQQRDTTDTRTDRYTGVLRLTYVWKESLSLEGEYDLERSITQSPIQREAALHQFFYIGYRYSF